MALLEKINRVFHLTLADRPNVNLGYSLTFLGKNIRSSLSASVLTNRAGYLHRQEITSGIKWSPEVLRS